MIRQFRRCAAAAVGVFVLAATMANADDSIKRAIADPGRIADAVARDASRKPAKVLAFSRIKTGDKVVEIAPGGGYYTALLSRVVGDAGHVYAVDPERIFAVYPQGREGFPKYIAADPRDNVTYSSQNLDDIEVPGNVDQVWMILYYHDTIYTDEDRAAMNQAFFDMLTPGGEYIVVDHHALAGADESVAQELHRMDAAVAKADIEAVGFVLDAESDILADPSDPRDDSVFAPERRGKTDRFVWRYVKPE